MNIITWAVLTAGWSVLAREYNTGRKNVTALEGATFFVALGVATAFAVKSLLEVT